MCAEVTGNFNCWLCDFCRLPNTGLNYAVCQALLLISVLIPFVGAAVVTLPVFAVAVLQFAVWDLALIMAAWDCVSRRQCVATFFRS